MSDSLKNSLMSQSTLSIVVCALACEAKPFIDFFKLKKNTSIHPFSVYQSGSVIVMVSGMGQHNMSAAVNWLSGYLNAKQTQFWLNIGVAGHQSATVGSLFCVHTLSDSQSTIYPTKWLKHKVTLEQLNSVNAEETAYKNNVLYDMEGFSFYQAATRFNSQECVQCLKVVSDNQQHAVNKDKTFISNLIAEQCEAIVAFLALHTNALNCLLLNTHSFDAFQTTLIEKIHFSHSQQLQLAKLCQSAHSHSINLNRCDLNNVQQSKPILAQLKQFIDAQAVTL